MKDSELKNRLQIAIGSKVSTDSVETEYHADFIDWYNRSRKHVIVCKGDGRFDPVNSSAILTHYIARWVSYVPVYDPITFLEYFHTLDADLTPVVYLYDLQILGQLPEYDSVRFFSSMKSALIGGIRVVMSMDCEFKRSGIDGYFKNKKVVDRFMIDMTNRHYCSKLEL